MSRVYDSWYQTPEAAATYRRARRKRILRASRYRRGIRDPYVRSSRSGFRNVGTSTYAPFIGPVYYKRTAASNYLLHNAVSSRRTYKFHDVKTANPYRFVSTHDEMVRELPVPLELQRRISNYLPIHDEL